MDDTATLHRVCTAVIELARTLGAHFPDGETEEEIINNLTYTVAESFGLVAPIWEE